MGTGLPTASWWAGEAAVACVQAALGAGITTFDTADVYAQGAAEELLGKALRGVRRESVEIATKVCLPTGDGPNDRGLSRKHIVESCHLCRPSRPAPGRAAPRRPPLPGSCGS